MNTGQGRSSSLKSLKFKLTTFRFEIGCSFGDHASIFYSLLVIFSFVFAFRMEIFGTGSQNLSRNVLRPHFLNSRDHGNVATYIYHVFCCNCYIIQNEITNWTTSGIISTDVKAYLYFILLNSLKMASFRFKIL